MYTQRARETIRDNEASHVDYYLAAVTLAESDQSTLEELVACLRLLGGWVRYFNL